MGKICDPLSTKKILFVSHKKAQCGVYEFGKNITDVIEHSQHYQFIRVECSSLNELENFIEENDPAAIIYNYYPSVMPWVVTKIAPMIYRNNIAAIQIPQIGIIHEVNQKVANSATSYKKNTLYANKLTLINSLFDFYIAPDPTLLLTNPCIFKTGRLIPSYRNKFQLPLKPVIGSFGFGTPNKGFEKIVELVQHEFDEAVIRFNIPTADFGDKNGINAQNIAKKCKSLIAKEGIKLIITHDFLSNKNMLDFLAKNTINVFLYETVNGRGLSSTIDNALSVQRPIAVSNSPMFRHLFDSDPSVFISENSLQTIINNGFAPLKKYCSEWNSDNLLWDYERILNSIFKKQLYKTSPKKSIIGTLRSKMNRLLSVPDKSFTWLRDSVNVTQDDMHVDPSEQYQPIEIPKYISLNRILDNKARKLYAPAVDKLLMLAPNTMSKKIPGANVQQAFVFDTVYRYLPKYQNPKVLCVGSNEDTACISLIKMGFDIEEIDPTKNYYLQEYITKPSITQNSYDVIFSTSVIEHDPDDESFVKCIAQLLAPGGIAVLTCDYKDGWKSNDPKPECDARLYTQHDLKDRLLPLMKNCNLIDTPQWDCRAPDFNYMGKYQYTFATFVIKKKQWT